MSPLEEKLSRLLAGYGAGIYAEKFKCSSLIRDVYGIQKKEANILIIALNAGVPEALLGQTGEEARHLQDRLVRQLEDSYGLSLSIAQWGVAAWAGMLGKAAPPEAGNEVPKKPSVASKCPPIRQLDLGGGVQLELVLIQPGTFLMGSPASEAQRSNDETQHQVTLTQVFYLGKYPVTQAQWKAVMGSNPSYFEGATLPVEEVSWDDAQLFCGKVGKKTGQVVGLPTDAQWEYSCRAGSSTPFHFGNILNGWQANCDGNFPYGTTKKGQYPRKTTPVGRYPANAWGLHDMHGNVWEWCQDWYGDYHKGPIKDPQGGVIGDLRILRGGSYDDTADNCRAAVRCRNALDFKIYFSYHCGFRLFMSPNPF